MPNPAGRVGQVERLNRRDNLICCLVILIGLLAAVVESAVLAGS